MALQKSLQNLNFYYPACLSLPYLKGMHRYNKWGGKSFQTLYWEKVRSILSSLASGQTREYTVKEVAQQWTDWSRYRNGQCPQLTDSQKYMITGGGMRQFYQVQCMKNKTGIPLGYKRTSPKWWVLGITQDALDRAEDIKLKALKLAEETDYQIDIGIKGYKILPPSQQAGPGLLKYNGALIYEHQRQRSGGLLYPLGAFETAEQMQQMEEERTARIVERIMRNMLPQKLMSPQKTCSNCQAQFPDAGYKLCPFCGATL